MARLVVKLDGQGRVAGHSPGPAREGWITPPDEVQLDPMSYLREPSGEWRVMTPEERAQFEADHTPDPPMTPARQRLRALQGKRTLSQAEMQQAILDIAATL